MKKILVLICLSAFCGGVGWAIPNLQLDIAGGTYSWAADQTTLSGGPTFDLYALALSANPDYRYFVSAAITPRTTSQNANFGSFVFGGTTYNAQNMEVGAPPIDAVS